MKIIVYLLLKFVVIKLPVIEPLKKLTPTIKPIGKLIVLLTIRFTSFLLELFCNPIIKIKNRVDEYPSTSIIINAANEIFVDQFLKKKVPFLSVIKIIMAILNDRKYKKYAIQVPLNINHITKVDSWARNKTMEIIKKFYE